MRALVLLVLLAGAAAWYLARRANDAAAAADSGDASATPQGMGAQLLEIVGRSVSTWRIPAAGQPYADAIAMAEQAQGLPANLLARVLYQESRFRSDIISGSTVSRTGALGIAQFMPATAAQLGINALDPMQAIPAAASYLRSLYDRFGDWSSALAAYNWGQGNVASKGLEAAPAETQAYVAQILGDVPV